MAAVAVTRTREFRRHQRRRAICRAMRLYKAGAWAKTLPERMAWALRNFKHRQRCSCYMCGHRRRWEGATIPERRQSQRERLPAW